GCGNGRDLRYLEEKGLKVIGLDISMGQLAVVRERSSETPNILLGDIVHLPFKDGKMDGALLVATLHHVPDQAERLQALNEVHRCLIQGGLCLLGVWAAEQPKFKDNVAQAKIEFQNDWEPGDILLDWNMPDGRIFKRYYHLFFEQEFDKLLEESNFSVEKRFFSVDNHYAILKKYDSS
ncbi:MAG: class I SAM-dependent methyltransferase, partial [Thermoplasmata archaeon]|nr:class I SAM-dependent methyltransferase [Thermoplasmata archaeon]